MTTFNYLTPLAEVRPVHNAGYGSFAIETISRGTVVATFGGTAVNRADFNEANEDRRSRSIQIDDDTFILGPPSREPGDCVNHSCTPNGGPRNAVQIVAMRDIAIGEELTFDYGMTDGSDYDEFECECGTSLCRGTISGTAWRSAELQQRYRGWFSPYLQRRIDAAHNARSLTKADVELLMNSYDAEPELALERALRVVLGRPFARFVDLVALTPCDDAACARLLKGETGELDALARLLNESRGTNFSMAYA